MSKSGEAQAGESGFSEFISECEEILARVALNLNRLEKDTWGPNDLDELYRDIHTVKGSAQLFGFSDIGVVGHAMESCLEPVRRLKLRPGTGLLDSLYRCVDLIESQVKAIAANGGKPEGDVMRTRIATIVPKLVEQACLQFGSEISILRDNFLFEEKLIKAEAVVSSPVPKVEAEEKIAVIDPEEKQGSPRGTVVDSSAPDTIRVQVGILDRLMNLIGEMVLVRNQVLQYSNRSEDLEFLNLSQRLDAVTSDLQDQVMRTRMQPIGSVVSKFQRLIRDLSKDLSKKIDLTIQGKDTELDKTLLEAIKDPLTHIVRNSCDHGIETVSERKTVGKPETGHVFISAYHEGGQVIIEISDDGKGLNRKKLIKKAIEKGLLTQEKTDRLSDRDTLNLIFLPGFSTAEKVSSVSGRGVGMDVVKTNVEKIGGSVDLESVEGKGTTIRLRIPLTLAIVPAMLVRSGGATYAIPQVKLVELVRIEQGREGENLSRIQSLQGKPVCELRGKILPLVDLAEIIRSKAKAEAKVETEFENQLESKESSTINIAVLSAEGEIFGLIVDEVLDTADIVVKPLSKFLKSLEVYSAATILGTGQVALIIDPAGVAKAARVSVAEKQEGAFSERSERERSVSSDQQEYLLFTTAAVGKYAVPLCMVNRLEELSSKDLEYSGSQPIIQYRGAILPLIEIGQALKLGDSGVFAKEQIPTIVVQRSGKLFGMVVNSILDVATVSNSVDDTIKDRDGILGSLICGDEVVTVVDVLSLIEKEDGSAPSASESRPSEQNSRRKPKVLYAEDVAFFRRQVSRLLTTHGYEVITVEDGRVALQLLSSPEGQNFDLILSDIEMPHLNGYQLAREVRQIEVLKKTPMVALTTRFSDRDVEEGLTAGFNYYLEKLNQESLLSHIQTLLDKKSESRTVA